MPEVFSLEEKILVQIDGTSAIEGLIASGSINVTQTFGLDSTKYTLFTRGYVSGLRAICRINQFQIPSFEPLPLGLSETERSEYQLARDISSEHMELRILLRRTSPSPATDAALLEAVLVNRGYSESMFLQPFLSDTANYTLPTNYELRYEQIDKGYGVIGPGSEIIVTGNLVYEVTAIQRVFDSVSWRSGKVTLALVANSNPPVYRGTANFYPITTYFGITHAVGNSEIFIGSSTLGEGLALYPRGAYEQWYSFYGFPLPNSLTFVSSEPATISFMCGGTQY